MPMPLFHTAGCVLATLGTLQALACQVVMPRFDPDLMLRLIEEEGSVGIGGVPTMLHALLAHEEKREFASPALRFAFSGGALVEPDLAQRVEATFGVPMAVIYAQTEASPGVTMTSLHDADSDRQHTVGKPLPHVEVKIVSTEIGPVLPCSEIGGLCTRGSGVMSGYTNPGPSPIDSDGWLHTGDLATMDERGYCQIVGRFKDMIIRGGENIYPWEVEALIGQHPMVAGVVVGMPDEFWGEQVAAVLTLRRGELDADLTDEFQHFVSSRLARHKVPTMWVTAEAFPTTGSGKVINYLVRQTLGQRKGHTPGDAT